MLESRKIVLVALLAASVAGCQSSPWQGRFMARSDASNAIQGDLVGAQLLEEGRQHLRDGNISRAVATFQLARMDSDSAAEANNGLAVAYAKIGRPDLAERYFRTAILLKPDDTRYVANLLRLQGQVLMAQQRAVTSRLAVAAAEGRSSAEPARRAISGRVHRVSRGEFRITTVAPERAPTMKVESRQAASTPSAAVTDEAPEGPAVELASAERSRQFEVVFAPWLQK